MNARQEAQEIYGTMYETMSTIDSPTKHLIAKEQCLFLCEKILENLLHLSYITKTHSIDVKITHYKQVKQEIINI